MSRPGVLVEGTTLGTAAVRGAPIRRRWTAEGMLASGLLVTVGLAAFAARRWTGR